MKSSELRGSLQRKGLAPVYLVLGEEDYLRDQALRVLTAAVLGDEGASGFNYDVFYGDESTAGDVLDCARELPAFAERRLVVVKGADKLPAREAEGLAPYLDAPSTTTCLVLSAAKLDGRLKFTQQLKSKAQVVDCAPPPAGQLPGWIREQARELGVDLSEEAVQVLGELTGHSLYLVRRELEKVAAATPAGRTAGAADVEALSGVEPGASVFDLSAATTSADHGRALRILVRNLEAGEAPLRILGSLLWQYRRLWKAHALLGEGRSAADIGRAVGIPPFRLGELLAQARAVTEGQLARAFRLFLEADNALKGGHATAPRRALEWCVLELCRDARGKGRRPAAEGARAAAPARAESGRRTTPTRTIRTIRSGTNRSN